jgi:hypothetical protein
MSPSLEVIQPDAVEDVLESPLKQKPKLIAPEPEHCVGPESEQAGIADSCAGCPNKSICASAPKGPDPDIHNITARLAGVKHKVLVLSGKGKQLRASLTNSLLTAVDGKAAWAKVPSRAFWVMPSRRTRISQFL